MGEAYRALAARFAQWNALRGGSSILQWDYAVMMPTGAASVRAEQLAALAEICHERITDPALGEWLAKAEDETLSDWERANLREMNRVWRHETAVPAPLVSALTHAATACESYWRTARYANDFKGLLPLWEEVLKLVRELAQAKAAALGLSPYDALLDSYDPGMRSEKIDGWFADLADFLPGFTQEVLARQASRPAPLPVPGPFPLEVQRRLGREFMERLGFDFARGRLDESAHPFCGGVPGDVRLTTRYREDGVTDSLYGVFHETGHALYEMQLPEAWRNQPVGEARGMSLHESQSLLMEMQLCRGRDFLSFAAPKLREAFSGSGQAWSEENLYRYFTRVTPSLIRVNADEVTYPSHIILRYRLEKAMIEGSLELADLPQAWNEGMQALLGVVPPDHAQGCLQDIHWPDGTFGYFPTYTLGAMIAAQLFAALCEAVPELSAQVRQGDFAPLRDWLKREVHGKGSFLETGELVQSASGAPFTAAAYKAHLRRRYLEE